MSSALSAAEGDVLNQMKGFVLDFNKKLGDIREVLSETISEAWDSENDILFVDSSPVDTANITNCIRMDSNENLRKVFLALSTVILEMNSLNRVFHNELFGQLSMFGHVVETEYLNELSESLDGNSKPKKAVKQKVESAEQNIAAFLPTLATLTNVVKRSLALIRNCIAQLAAIYSDGSKLYSATFKHVELDLVFNSIGELATSLLTVDHIIADNTILIESWAAYKRMIKLAKADPSRVEVSSSKLAALEQLVGTIDERFFISSAFRGVLGQEYGLPDPSNPYVVLGSSAIVTENKVFCQVFSEHITNSLSRLNTSLKEPIEIYPRSKFVDVAALYAIYRALFRKIIKIDAKLYRSVWAIQGEIPLVPLFGRSVWLPADFLITFCPAPEVSSIKPGMSQIAATRRSLMLKMDEEFPAKIHDLYLQTCVWMVRIESELLSSQLTPPNNSSAQRKASGPVLNARAKLVIQGVLLARQIRTVVDTAIQLHITLNSPFQKANVRPLAVGVELLKSIQLTYRRRMSMISDNSSLLIAQTSETLRRVFEPVRAKMEARDSSHSKLNDTKADVLAAAVCGLHTLTLPQTKAHRIVASLALAVAQNKLVMKGGVGDEVRYQLWRMERLVEYQQDIASASDCSFLYWIINVVPIIFTDVTANPDQANRLQYLFSGLKDCSVMLQRNCPDPNPVVREALARRFIDEVKEMVKRQIIEAVARKVETDLRLHIHSVILQQDSLKPSDPTDLSRILEIKPLRLFDEILDVREQVARYLSASFYNHNTVALHDSRVYSEMRNLAREKFGLEMDDSHLPANAHYSEALDILEIMRNIHIFVARYNYNMNSQFFIERALDQKHLNVIDVAHISSSIATHGTGIMNTTVNFTYQFLCRKLVLISEFLFDEHVKSPLIRDIRHFKSRKDELKNRYPYEDAEKFVRDVRKLGVTSSGLTYLDQLRLQVTEIGNALGYVRLVRSGGLRYSSSAAQFIPDLQSEAHFKALCEKSGLPESTIAAASNLDQVLTELKNNVAEGTEYFLVLVRIFNGVFSSEEQSHIANFYAIIPALTLSFIDAIIGKKDRVHKRVMRDEASFCDDGFALGLAYLLRLFDQDALFDAMHWFESVLLTMKKKKYDAKVALDQGLKSKAKTFDKEAAQVTFMRHETHVKEFELLSHAVRGARIFFRDITRAAGPTVGTEGTLESA